MPGPGKGSSKGLDAKLDMPLDDLVEDDQVGVNYLKGPPSSHTIRKVVVDGWGLDG